MTTADSSHLPLLGLTLTPSLSPRAVSILFVCSRRALACTVAHDLKLSGCRKAHSQVQWVTARETGIVTGV